MPALALVRAFKVGECCADYGAGVQARGCDVRLMLDCTGEGSREQRQLSIIVFINSNAA